MTKNIEDKAEGMMNEAKGRVKDAVGGLTGDAKTQASGKIDQMSGMAQQEFADIYDEAETILERATVFVQDRPVISVIGAMLVGLFVGMLMKSCCKAK